MDTKFQFYREVIFYSKTHLASQRQDVLIVHGSNDAVENEEQTDKNEKEQNKLQPKVKINYVA